MRRYASWMPYICNIQGQLSKILVQHSVPVRQEVYAAMTVPWCSRACMQRMKAQADLQLHTYKRQANVSEGCDRFYCSVCEYNYGPSVVNVAFLA